MFLKPVYSHPFFFLGAVWFCLQVFLCRQYGIVTDLEATKYIQQADFFLAHGRYETGNYLFYSTQILLIAACKKIHAGYWPVVGLQMLFNALSLLCFYGLVLRFTTRPKVAFWFTAALLSMYYYQLYTVYLFTESLYFSFSIIFCYALVRVKKLSLTSLFGIVSGLTVLYLTRPVGIFFIPATFLFLLFRFYPKKAFLLLITIGILGLGLFYFLVNKSLRSGGELDFLLPYLDERIICGVPTIAHPHQITTPMEKNSVEGLLYVITHYWPLFFSLSLKRLAAFFGVLRPYFSTLHNVFIGLYFYTVYVLIFLSIPKWKKELLPPVLFAICLLFLTALTTALSCDEWHNRFILAILPFLLLLAALVFKPQTRKHLPDAEPTIV